MRRLRWKLVRRFMPDVELLIYGPDAGVECGEDCERPADIGIAGFTYCSQCLHDAILLGGIFSDAIDNAQALRESS